jgi:hypothetical protein
MYDWLLSIDQVRNLRRDPVALGGGLCRDTIDADSTVSL